MQPTIVKDAVHIAVFAVSHSRHNTVTILFLTFAVAKINGAVLRSGMALGVAYPVPEPQRARTVYNYAERLTFIERPRREVCVPVLDLINDIAAFHAPTQREDFFDSLGAVLHLTPIYRWKVNSIYYDMADSAANINCLPYSSPMLPSGAS